MCQYEESVSESKKERKKMKKMKKKGGMMIMKMDSNPFCVC